MGQDPHLDPLGVNAMPQLEVNQCLLLILTGFTGHRLCQDSGLKIWLAENEESRKEALTVAGGSHFLMLLQMEHQ